MILFESWFNFVPELIVDNDVSDLIDDKATDDDDDDDEDEEKDGQYSNDLHDDTLFKLNTSFWSLVSVWLFIWFILFISLTVSSSEWTELLIINKTYI